MERLRGYGFKTFEGIWDESYDDIISPKERFNKVCELVKHLNESNNLKDLYIQSKDILEYNQELAFNFWKRDTCTEYFKKLANEITAI